MGSSDGRVQSVERVPTDQIAIIGDLSTSIVMLPDVDLRAGGRRALWMLGLVGAALAGAVAGVVFTFTAHNAPAAQRAASDQTAPVAAAMTSPVATAVAVRAAAAPVQPAQPVKPLSGQKAKPAPAKTTAKHVAQPAPVTRTAPPTRTSAQPAEQPVAVPPELQADDDRCDQSSCAAHGNERECCAPFRAQQPAKLERAQIAPVIASFKAKALDCRSTEGEGLVKIAVDVHSDGSVSHAMVLESPEASVGECVARVVRSAQFPVTDQGGSFVYRLDLAAP